MSSDSLELSAFQLLQDRASQHWADHAREDSFQTTDNIRINFARLDVYQSRTLVVVANGRTETYLKYKDIALVLNEAGYSVLLYDHRGQGLSERMLSDPRKGYVKNFDDYVGDIKQLFALEIANDKRTDKVVLLSHSMGGTVSALYVQQHPHDFDALIMASPMLGLPAGAAGRWLATTVTLGESVMQRWFDYEPGYIPGIGQYSDIPFDDNGITHSIERFRHVGTLIRENPQVALGDPTTHWVRESYRAFDQLFAGVSKIVIPTLVLQAGDDKIVSNDAQDSFCAQLQQYCTSGTPVVIDGAKHELLNEADEFRNRALDSILTFLERNTTDVNE